MPWTSLSFEYEKQPKLFEHICLFALPVLSSLCLQQKSVSKIFTWQWHWKQTKISNFYCPFHSLLPEKVRQSFQPPLVQTDGETHKDDHEDVLRAGWVWSWACESSRLVRLTGPRVPPWVGPSRCFWDDVGDGDEGGSSDLMVEDARGAGEEQMA